MNTEARVSRIPVATRQPAERFELQTMQRAPAPVGKAMARIVTPHWSTTFADAVNNHVWRKDALDAFESHSFTGKPGTERWCTRCTLMLPPDWKDPKKPVPLHCGDPGIRFKAAFYDPTPPPADPPKNGSVTFQVYDPQTRTFSLQTVVEVSEKDETP